MLLMTRVGADTPLWQTDLYMLIFGSGLGLNMQTIVLAMQNAVEPKDMGVSTAAVTFFRQVGGTLGTAIFLSILFTRAAANIPHQYGLARSTPAFRQAAAAHPQQVKLLQGGGSIDDTAFVQHLDKTLAHPYLVGFSDAMDTVFLVGACVLVLAVVLSLLMKEIPLRNLSGQQAAHQERAATADAAAPEHVDVALSVPTDAQPGGAPAPAPGSRGDG
jgi:hypothetical protein